MVTQFKRASDSCSYIAAGLGAFFLILTASPAYASSTDSPAADIPTLIKQLSDKKLQVRRYAAMRLGRAISGSPSFGDAVSARMRANSPPAPELDDLGNRAVAELMKMMENDDEKTARLEATFSLSEIHPPAREVLPVFAKRLESEPDEYVQSAIADAIWLYKNDAHFIEEQIRSALRRAGATKVAMSLIRCLDGIEPLTPESIEALLNVKMDYPDSAIRIQAAGVLKRHHSDGSLSPVDQALTKTPSSPADIELLLKVARSITPSEAEFIAASGIASSPETDRTRALARLAAPDKTAKLSDLYLPLLKDSDAGIRSSAASALSVLREKRAIAGIRKLLQALPRNSFNPAGPNGAVPFVVEN
jgi:HEAT repeat protein